MWAISFSSFPVCLVSHLKWAQQALLQYIIAAVGLMREIRLPLRCSVWESVRAAACVYLAEAEGPEIVISF